MFLLVVGLSSVCCSGDTFPSLCNGCDITNFVFPSNFLSSFAQFRLQQCLPKCVSFIFDGKDWSLSIGKWAIELRYKRHHTRDYLHQLTKTFSARATMRGEDLRFLRRLMNKAKLSRQTFFFSLSP